MSVTMTDADQVTYACEPEDSKGQPVADTLTWSSDDNGAVVTLTPSADTRSCVFAAVAPGTANISVTVTNASGTPLLEADGTTPFTVPAPVAVTVGAGPASELVLSVND